MKHPPNWQIHHKAHPNGSILAYQIQDDDVCLNWREVLNHWEHNPAFTRYFHQVLAEAPFSAFFWECPPLTQTGLDQEFAFVLVNSPGLAGVEAEPHAYQAYFDSDQAVVSFDNLGGDALLVAPTPQGPDEAYPHLAAFCRKAAAAQQLTFWQQVAREVSTRLSARPLWLSTSGLGVYWLHVRLDQRPKYYQHAPYRRWPQ